MDRNSTIGLALIAAILIGYGYFVSPSKEELAKQKAVQDSIAQVEAKQATEMAAQQAEQAVFSADNDSTQLDSTTLAAVSAELERKHGAFAALTQQAEKEIAVSTDKFDIVFTSKGAKVKSVTLKEYTTSKGAPVQLFDPNQYMMDLQFDYPGLGTYQTADLNFATSSPTQLSISGEQEAKISFEAKAANGANIILSYIVKGDKYDVDAVYNLGNLSGVADLSKPVLLNWQAVGITNEKNPQMERAASSVYYCYNDDERDYLSERSDDEEVLEEKTNWVAFKQDFFSAIAISDVGFEPNTSQIAVNPRPEEDTVFTKEFGAKLALPISQTQPTTSVKFFFGPNQFKILKSYKVNELDRIIDFGWAIFGWVNKHIIVWIFNFLEGFNLSYGIIILILTLLIKMVLMPLNYKNYVSSAKMRVLKPQIEKINAKFKDGDAMKKQQETMNLYRETGVNPLAGCIPMLIQMPILYAMFRFFPASIELRQESFLWADDLSSYDAIISWATDIPLISSVYGNHISLFTILLAISTFFYTKLNNTTMPEPQPGMPDMRFMVYLFPFMMLIFFNKYAAGLSYYYFLSNLVSMIQTYVFRNYVIDEGKLLAKIEARQAQRAKGGKSKFQQRMEDMAKKRGVKLPK